MLIANGFQYMLSGRYWIQSIRNRAHCPDRCHHLGRDQVRDHSTQDSSDGDISSDDISSDDESSNGTSRTDALLQVPI